MLNTIINNEALGVIFPNSYDGLVPELVKERLMASINRRKNLLANENYVSKAPANIVENDRNNLQKEENELKLIEEKLNK